MGKGKPTVEFKEDQVFILDEDTLSKFSKITKEIVVCHKKWKKEIETLLNKECHVDFIMSLKEPKQVKGD